MSAIHLWLRGRLGCLETPQHGTVSIITALPSDLARLQGLIVHVFSTCARALLASCETKFREMAGRAPHVLACRMPAVHAHCDYEQFLLARLLTLPQPPSTQPLSLDVAKYN